MKWKKLNIANENKIIQADNKLLIEKFLELSKLINEPNGDSSILLHTCFLIR